MTPADIDYVSIYDSFTITVLQTIEDLGFCEKGKGGAFVADGALQAPHGRLPFNTDGGGLCNNHPANRGGMTKMIEAVRQLRGEANRPGAGARLRARARARQRRVARHPDRQPRRSSSAGRTRDRGRRGRRTLAGAGAAGQPGDARRSGPRQRRACCC